MGTAANIAGICLILAFIYALSENRRAINFKLVIKALLAQMVLALVLVKVPLGVKLVEAVSNGILFVIGFAKNGLQFIFGSLGVASSATGFIFAIHVLGNIIFLGALVGLLTYTGILGSVIKLLGGLLGRFIGTSATESFICVANMFLGQTESPLLVAKYLGNMTRSEIFMVLVAGMSSMSVSIMGGYNAMGVPMPALVLACSLIPLGSIVLGKIMIPEVEHSSTTALEVDRKSAGSTAIEALANGSFEGLKLSVAIAASLAGIISFIALVNGFLAFANLSLEQLVGYIFYPVGWLMGLDGDYAMQAAQILGVKFVTNEFVAFDMLVKITDAMTPRSSMILFVAVGGFANIASMAVCLSGIGVLCPARKSLVAQIIVRALAGAYCLNLMNGMLVGIMMSF